jgi:hypothetical protein
MMKKNIYMRIGVLLFIAVLATSGVFVGSGTYAKYIAAATVEATARVAKFEVQIRKALTTGTTPTWTADNGGYLTFSQSSAAAMNLNTSWGTMNLGTVYDVTPVTPSATPDANGALTTNIKVDLATPETHISTYNTTNDGSIIAPGTGGRFCFQVKNNSEVSVRFSLDSIDATAGVGVTYTGTPSVSTANIEFSTDNNTWYSANDFGAMLTAAYNANKWIDLGPGATWTFATDGTQGCIYWRWRFNRGNDATAIKAQDTADTALGVAAVTSVGTMTLKIGIKAVQID